MLQSIEGIYKKGQIGLLEIPNNIEESPVIITFLETSSTPATPKIMSFGMFKGTNKSTSEDFLMAEFKGDLDNYCLINLVFE
ncbi:MAG: hypothetical protein AB4062_21855 [Crocosphaera sp.]